MNENILKQDFKLKQYEMMGQELLEIHARTDKLEQFFVAVIGAIYAFGFQTATGLSELIFFIPTFISVFVFARLELLSHVRSIMRIKLIEFEKRLGGKNSTGQYTHSQELFYGNVEAVKRDSFKLAKIFCGQVSDRARFWKWSIWLTFFAGLVANIEADWLLSIFCSTI